MFGGGGRGREVQRRISLAHNQRGKRHCGGLGASKPNLLRIDALTTYLYIYLFAVTDRS